MLKGLARILFRAALMNAAEEDYTIKRGWGLFGWGLFFLAKCTPKKANFSRPHGALFRGSVSTPVKENFCSFFWCGPLSKTLHGLRDMSQIRLGSRIARFQFFFHFFWTILEHASGGEITRIPTRRNFYMLVFFRIGLLGALSLFSSLLFSLPSCLLFCFCFPPFFGQMV